MALTTPASSLAVPQVGRCLFALAAAALATAGCAKAPDPRWPAANELVVTLTNGPTHLDPRVGTDAASGRAFELLYSGLLSTDPQGNLIPDLALSWSVEDGGRRYRFSLRPGVAFHDGRPLTARDVVWTYSSLAQGAVVSAKEAAWKRVTAVRALDPETVEFELAEPFGSFLIELTRFTGVVPEGATPEEMNAHPLGTGPFRFVSRTTDELVVERYPEYYGGPAPLERVVLRVVPDATVRALELMKGSVQLIINDLPPDLVPRFRRHDSYRVAEDPGAVYAYLGLNLQDPVLADLRVRRALLHAIDRERLVSTLWQGLGQVTETMLPPGLWARHEDLQPYRFDPEEARRLLDEAGWPDPDGPGPEARFTLSYKTSTNEPYVLQAQILQQMLAQVGVRVEIRAQEFATFYEDLKRGNFQVFSLLRFGVTDPHIYALVAHSASRPPAGQNRVHYQNPELDRLVDRAAALADPAERRPLYLRVQEIYRDELPYLSLYTRTNVAVMPALLRGYRNYPNGELLSLEVAYWDRDGQRPGEAVAASPTSASASASVRSASSSSSPTPRSHRAPAARAASSE